MSEATLTNIAATDGAITRVLEPCQPVVKSGSETKIHDWALITGAASRAGRGFARKLAARGLNLILVAPAADLIEGLARELIREHGVLAKTVGVDLGSADAADEIEASTWGLSVGLLVNGHGPVPAAF